MLRGINLMIKTVIFRLSFVLEYIHNNVSYYQYNHYHYHSRRFNWIYPKPLSHLSTVSIQTIKNGVYNRRYFKRTIQVKVTNITINCLPVPINLLSNNGTNYTNHSFPPHSRPSVYLHRIKVSTQSTRLLGSPPNCPSRARLSLSWNIHRGIRPAREVPIETRVPYIVCCLRYCK